MWANGMGTCSADIIIGINIINIFIIINIFKPTAKLLCCVYCVEKVALSILYMYVIYI